MLFTYDQKRVLDRSIHEFGEEVQFDIAVGECGEYAALAGKKRQNRLNESDEIDEIVDVLIAMEQRARIIGYEKVRKRFDEKMQRLRDILDGNTNHPAMKND